MTVRKRITYLSGTRADFGLMRPVLDSIAQSDLLDLEVVVTGMHLSERFGRTEADIVASGHSIARRIEVPIDDDSGRAMGVAAGRVTEAMSAYLAETPRDALLLLGDRGEMLAGAIAALFAGTAIVHVAGGERSGSVDESIRHAISKLAHIHCVSADDSRKRLVGMGEDPARIHVVGAPGLVGLSVLASHSRDELARIYGFDSDRPYALLLFHPVVQDAAKAEIQWREILDALAGKHLQILCLMPNADHGASAIRSAIETAALGDDALIPIVHMPRAHYLSALRHAEFLIGNSSSGIVEAASLGTPVVNVGDRQHGRLRNANVFDVDCSAAQIRHAIDAAEKFDAIGLSNVYGAGCADRQIRDVLETVDFHDPALFKKVMPY